MAKGALTQAEANLNSRTNEYRHVLESQKKLVEDKQKLAGLRQLSTNRFLFGSLLNSLQQTAVSNVQFVHLNIYESCTLSPETRATGKTPAKPATVTEKIVLTLNGRDTSPSPGAAATELPDALWSAPYLQKMMGKTNGFRLVSLGTQQSDPDGKAFLFFTIEGRFPEKAR